MFVTIVSGNSRVAVPAGEDDALHTQRSVAGARCGYGAGADGDGVTSGGRDTNGVGDGVGWMHGCSPPGSRPPGPVIEQSIGSSPGGGRPPS